jgi:hypothetical protein
MIVSLQNLERAVAIRRQIDRLQQELASMLRQVSGNNQGPRRRMSPEARAKIAAAARARWARTKKSAKTSSSKTGKVKRGLSPAGRRRLSQLMKARWAAKRAGAGGKK